MNDARRIRVNLLQSNAGKAKVVLGWGKNVTTQIAGALQWDKERSEFPTLSTADEIALLKEGKVPPEVIYSGKAGDKLTAIDDKESHIYSSVINGRFKQMLLLEWRDLEINSKKLRNCLWNLDTRLDIGTWNGIVSNTAAFSVSRIADIASRDIASKRSREWDTEEIFTNNWKPRFVCCDLSEASLKAAENLANDEFHNLSQSFTIEYYQGAFQKFLQSENKNTGPRLITMFNILANFKLEELKKILQDVANSMKPGDVFMPTFFLMHSIDKKVYHYNTPFGLLTKMLYENPETRERCMSAFCERYKVSPSNVVYHTDRGNDGRDFIDVSLFVEKDTNLHIPESTGKDIKVAAKECDTTTPMANSFTKFNVFHSYRMHRDAIEELCRSAWFEIDYRLRSPEGLQIAPVLYKP